MEDRRDQVNAEKLKALFPNASEAFLKANAAIEEIRQEIDARKPGIGVRYATEATKTVAPIRQNCAAKLNKTEAAFLEHLRSVNPKATILSQAVNLEIANGCQYRPDFLVVTEIFDRESGSPGVYLQAFEVKGFFRDDAVVKIKVAARAHPWICFWLARRKSRSAPWDLLLVDR